MYVCVGADRNLKYYNRKVKEKWKMENGNTSVGSFPLIIYWLANIFSQLNFIHMHT